MYFIENLSLLLKPEAPLNVMHTFVERIYDFYVLSWKCCFNVENNSLITFQSVVFPRTILSHLLSHAILI